MLQISAIVVGLSLSHLAEARPETAAEHLYRRGVHCQEVLERNDCAIEKFEALMDQRTNQRDLVTDGMLRLITLYDKEGRSEDIPDVVRRFWDVGRARASSGHVPYSVRFFPPDVDVLVNLDTPKIAQSGVMKRLGDDARDMLFSCDEARRETLKTDRRRRKAERKAKKTGRPVDEVLAESEAKERAYEAERNRTKGGEPSPIFVEAACPIARALGDDDLLGWTRMTGAFDHDHARRSVAAAQIPGLAAKLEDAQTRGAIVRQGPDHWILAGTDYDGAPIHLASLDVDELVAAPEAIIDDMIVARGKRRRQMDRGLAKLVGEVPRDTGFFMVVSEQALVDMSFGGAKKSTRNFLQALLPRPKGLQVAAVFTDTAALFTRVPTDTPVKAKMLAGLANRLLWRAAEDDPEAAQWLEGLDIAESTDRKALLASYVAPAGKLGKLEEMIAG